MSALDELVEMSRSWERRLVALALDEDDTAPPPSLDDMPTAETDTLMRACTDLANGNVGMAALVVSDLASALVFAVKVIGKLSGRSPETLIAGLFS